MITFFSQITLICILLSVFNCKEKDWREEMKNSNSAIDQQIQKDHDYLKSLQKDHYIFKDFARSKEEAILLYLKNLKFEPSYNEEIKFSFNKNELKTILYPNSLGYGTSLDKTPLKNYEELVWARKKIGEEKILQHLKTKNFKILKIVWKEDIRKFRKLNGYKPESIEVSQNGSIFYISEIKQVIEHNGQFKVAIIAP
jgi:hypothetical protein